MQQAAAGAAGALAAVSLAASNALGASLTYDELQGLTYKEVKGTGIANECPLVDNKNAQSDLSSLNPGEYSLQQFCMEPTKFQVQEDESKGFQDTKLMTRLTYTLDGMTGKFKYGRDGKIGIEESEGIDYAATTVKLPGGDKVPFLFSMKSLKAEGKADDIKGEFNVPSYRGATFLDPKGRGEVTGYDNAVALPAKSDDEELSKENAKSTAPSKGNARFRVTAYNPETKEVGGVFESLQPSDTDLGAKTPKDGACACLCFKCFSFSLWCCVVYRTYVRHVCVCLFTLEICSESPGCVVQQTVGRERMRPLSSVSFVHREERK